MIPRKKLEFPLEISGRRVTNRGVHLQPFGFHGDWLKRAGYWTDLLVSMGVSWVVLLTDGDSVRQTYTGAKNPLQVLLDAGIIPIIREQKSLPLPFTEQDTVLWTIDLYGKYGLKPFWIIRNEPFDSREWVKGEVPPNAWDLFMGVWSQAAQFIADKGGYVGFPDGPGYDFNPFDSIKQRDGQWLWDEGKAFYAGHHYGKNRHRDYPYDAVTRYGAQLTQEAYDRLLDDFAEKADWRSEPLELINRRRKELFELGITAAQDDICWRGWELVAHRSLESFGYVVPMAMTEGGWTPRDRPGSGPNTDIRMPLTTPKMVGKKTMQMFDTPSPFFAICPWLLADEDMGGSGWPTDAWHGWAFEEEYGRKKPVITALQYFPPKEEQRRDLPLVIDVDGDTQGWNWVQRSYGAKYRRGNSRLQLIEVHEYEGPATLDVWVVDGDGLPVEGIPFFHSYPDAPPIDGDEWYHRAAVRFTNADGRIHFPAMANPGPPGAGTEALWPAGKGDILESLGLIEGTRNRRLGGLWQLVEKGTPPLPDPPDLPPILIPIPTPGPMETSTWEMIVEHRPGPQVIAGTLPRAGIDVTVTDPWGNASSVVSGSKLEHGLGGFEVLSPEPVQYTIAFLDQRFEVLPKGGLTFLTFLELPKAEPPAVPEHAPDPLDTAPQPAGAPQQQALKKLARIEELLAKLPPD